MNTVTCMDCGWGERDQLLEKIKSWCKKHRLLLIIITGICIIALFFYVVGLLLSKGCFGSYADGWLSFLGGFIGGVATLGSVVLTIRHGDKEREREKRESQRVFLDIMFHEGASEDRLRNFDTDAIKTLYLFDGVDPPVEGTRFASLQIINRSSMQVSQVHVVMMTQEEDGKEHTRFSNIPYVHPSERDFIVLPKAVYMAKPTKDPTVLERPNKKIKAVEEITKIRIEYRTLSGETIKLTIDNNLMDYKYRIDNDLIFSFKCSSHGKVLMPKS